MSITEEFLIINTHESKRQVVFHLYSLEWLVGCMNTWSVACRRKRNEQILIECFCATTNGLLFLSWIFAIAAIQSTDWVHGPISMYGSSPSGSVTTLDTGILHNCITQTWDGPSGGSRSSNNAVGGAGRLRRHLLESISQQNFDDSGGFMTLPPTTTPAPGTEVKDCSSIFAKSNGICSETSGGAYGGDTNGGLCPMLYAAAGTLSFGALLLFVLLILGLVATYRHHKGATFSELNTAMLVLAPIALLSVAASLGCFNNILTNQNGIETVNPGGALHSQHTHYGSGYNLASTAVAFIVFVVLLLIVSRVLMMSDTDSKPTPTAQQTSMSVVMLDDVPNDGLQERFLTTANDVTSDDNGVAHPDIAYAQMQN